MMVSLGCPRYCVGRLCVDLYPLEPNVLKGDAYEFLRATINAGRRFYEVRSDNLLEHLGNVDEFLKLSYQSLREGGRIVVVTDNAEFLPFYLPFDIPGTGIGAHAAPSYAKRFNVSHRQIFTKLHLSVALEENGFKRVSVRRVKFGTRLEAVGYR